MTAKKKKIIDWHIVCMGIGCITIIEITALLKGIDGVLLTVVIGILALAIGVAVPKEKILG